MSEPVPRYCRRGAPRLQVEQPAGGNAMDASNRDALSAVVARQRGRGRLRSATVALGAASLVAAGAIAYTLPSGVTHTSATATAGTATAGSGTAHATSGGSREASASWRALGTGVQVTVTDAGQLAAARGMLEADLAAVDLACSRFRPDSEIVGLDRVMSGAAARPATVSPLLAEAVAVALRAARLTDGDVDPTVGAAMNAIGYDRDFSLVQRDGPAVRLTVRTIPGWRQVELDEQALLLRLPPGVRLDLGATAKAWAADRSAARIAALLGCGVLVSLGGDIAVSGPPPPGGWRIRVQDFSGRPEDPPAGPSAVVAIRGGGLATSSTAARRWRRGGDVLHHILDPR